MLKNLFEYWTDSHKLTEIDRHRKDLSFTGLFITDPKSNLGLQLECQGSSVWTVGAFMGEPGFKFGHSNSGVPVGFLTVVPSVLPYCWLLVKKTNHNSCTGRYKSSFIVTYRHTSN